MGGKQSGLNTTNIYVNGECGGPQPTPIPVRVTIAYRDEDGNTIPRAPEDRADYDTIVWKNGPVSKSYSTTAEHAKLDPYGWRYVGYQIYSQFSVPGNSTIADHGIDGDDDDVEVTVGLGNQKFVIVFIYEPIMLKISHYNIDPKTNTQTLINTDKNGEFKLGELIPNKNNPIPIPNHYCSRLGCEEGEHIATSLHKWIWPGHILLNYEIKDKNGNSLRIYEYDLTGEYSNVEDTTVIPGDNEDSESKKYKPQKYINVGMSAFKGKKGYTMGHKPDIELNFYYSGIVIHVSHNNYPSGEVLMDLEGTTKLEYDQVLNGDVFVVPSLSTVKTNTFKPLGVQYNIDKWVIKKVEVYKAGKLIEPIIGKDLIGNSYYWLFASSDKTLINYTNEIKKIGNDVSIKFYYQKVPMLIVRHVDDKGNLLTEEERIPMESGDVIVKKKDFSSSGYKDKYYEDENKKTHYPVEEQYLVKNEQKDKTVTFVYNRETPPTETDKKQALIRSNARPDGKKDEEYNVEIAIPTSEDLYANVITNAVVLRDTVKIGKSTQKLNLKIVKQFYERNDTDTEIEGEYKPVDMVYSVSDNLTVEVPFDYYYAGDTKLDILSKAIFKNESIYRDKNGNIDKDAGDEDEKATINAKYDGNEPILTYEKGGKWKIPTRGTNPEEKLKNELHNLTPLTPGFYDVIYNDDGSISATLVLKGVSYSKPDMNEILSEYSDPIVVLGEAKSQGSNDIDEDYYAVKVTMDKLSVILEPNTTKKEYIVLSGAELKLGASYTLEYLKEKGYIDLDTISNIMAGGNVVYKDLLYKNNEIYVKKDIENRSYTTTVDIYYKEHKKIDESGKPIDGSGKDAFEETLNANPIVVHTPVVNYTKLVLDSNKKYNQLIPSQNNDVLVIGETFTVKIPHSGSHITSDGYGPKKYNYQGLVAEDGTLYNKKPKSFASQKLIKFDFDVIYNNICYQSGQWISLALDKENYDFIIPTWEEEKWNGEHRFAKIYTKVIAENANSSRIGEEKNYNKSPSNYVAIDEIDVKIIGKMYDLQIRATNDTGWANFVGDEALKVEDFPLGQEGQNKVSAYKYGLKLGSKVFFDLKTYGSRGVDTSKQIMVEPKYYFVSKEGGEAREVKLYYHTLKEKYLKMSETPIVLTTTMSQNYGAKYFPEYNKNLGLTSRITKENYTTLRNIGYSNLISLTDKWTRIIAYNNSVDVIKAMLKGNTINKYIPDTYIPDETNVINSIGRWYGEFRVPASTIIAEKNTTDAEVKAGKILKDGYLIVAFKKDTLRTYTENGSKYLSYNLPSSNTQWKQEDAKTRMRLPNNKEASIDDSCIAMAIYEGNLRINNDYETVGTH